MTLVDRRPSGLLRMFFRVPILAYRAHLGRLLGHRFLYLAHRGRTSGKRREVVLEVVRWDPRVPTVVVVSAWGTRSDWFRNLEAAPALELRIAGRRWVEPEHRVLDAAHLRTALRGYAAQHPRAWAALAPKLGLEAELTPESLALAAERFPAVAFRPRP
jgi:deazaflavin-dependent oxidoreductase (nitroreductase family)